MSKADEIAKLVQLRDQGVLTNEEFEGQKAAVLNGDTSSQVTEAAPRAKKGVGKGCLIAVAVIVVLIIIGAIASGGDNATSGATTSGAATSVTAADEPTSGASAGLFGPQANAARSAQQYLAMSGFSRRGLIEQLSSDAGSGYSVADSTAAVDSLKADWNEQAARSAKEYLKMSGFSCSGLVEQLSSDAGSKYTKAQARFGAKQAGAC